MDGIEELLQYEFLVLRDIRLNGRAADEVMLRQLLDNELVRRSADTLELTGRGRRLLVRGSPALWDLTS